MFVTYDHDPTRAWFAGILVALGALSLGVGSATGTPLAVRLVLSGLFVAAAGVLVLQRAEVTRRPVAVLPHWDNGRVYKCLRRAAPDAQVRILQTWIPEKEQLCHRLEDLILEHGQRFRLQVMLMHPGEPRAAGADLLDARVRHRDETRDYARSQIIDTARRFLALKTKVDRGLAERGGRLNLSVRLYRFMPFGPLYQIGDRLFIGYYHPSRSSLNAPMLEIRGESGPVWRAFHSVFAEAWEEAEEVVDIREGELVAQALGPAGSDRDGDVLGGTPRRSLTAVEPFVDDRNSPPGTSFLGATHGPSYPRPSSPPGQTAAQP